MKEQNLERSLPIYFGQQKTILFQIQVFRFTNLILIDPNWTNNKLIEVSTFKKWISTKNHQSVPRLVDLFQSGRSKVDGRNRRPKVKASDFIATSDTRFISQSGRWKLTARDRRSKKWRSHVDNQKWTVKNERFKWTVKNESDRSHGNKR